MHHHTNFTYKMFGSSEGIVQTNINILNHHYGLDLQCSNLIFAQDTPANDDVLSNQVWLERISSSEATPETVTF